MKQKGKQLPGTTGPEPSMNFVSGHLQIGHYQKHACASGRCSELMNGQVIPRREQRQTGSTLAAKA